jgi:hypothetical protein
MRHPAPDRVNATSRDSLRTEVVLNIQSARSGVIGAPVLGQIDRIGIFIELVTLCGKVSIEKN